MDGDENGNNRKENFEKAKVLLLGAVDTVLELANNGKEVYSNLDNAPCTSRGRHGNSSRGVFEKNTIVCLVLNHLRRAKSSRTGSGKEKEACRS